MKLYKKAILPLGFKANAVACGIKKSGKLDLALLYSEIPAKSSCYFTTNKIQAACLKLNKKHLISSKVQRAIIINSGNANCFTGRQGVKDADETAKTVAKFLGVPKNNVLVASTGIIARRLPLDKIKNAVPQLVEGLSEWGIDKAKKAIMTTDTFVKEITIKFKIGSKTITVCGIAKGAGMIAPCLSRNATMLCFILTDAQITQNALDRALNIAVDNSFNCITVDGCMSTNDMVVVLANAMAQNSLIDTKKNFNLFVKVLNITCLELAKMIVKDAEGATKFIRIKVDGAKSVKEAREVAFKIANSNLFKTAMFASSPNVYGRIVASLGASGVDIKEKKLRLWFSPLKRKEIDVVVSLGCGRASATVYTSDLSYEYVRINAQYN